MPPKTASRPDLSGLWAFALTPFGDDLAIDRDAYVASAAWLAEDADVVCAGGTLGQGDRMSDAERLMCVDDAVAGVAGRRPVMGVVVAGDGDGATAASMQRAGATAILLLPATGDVADIEHALVRIGAATGGALATVVYQRGALRLTADELLRLCEQPHLAGLKDAHGDLRAFRRLRGSVGARLAWIGASEDLVLGYWALGADAFSPASLAYAPGYARRWWAALRAGQVAEARRLMELFAWPLTDLRMSRPDIDITVVHELAIRYGRPAGRLRPPAAALSPAELATLHSLADRLDAELSREDRVADEGMA